MINYDLFDDVITKIKFEPLSRQQQYNQLERILKAEREECAKICDYYADGSRQNMSDICADKIRERNNT